MERIKIPHSTCEHARVRLFYPPILTSQDFARRSGNRDTKAPPTSTLRDYGLARQAQESVGGGLRLVAYASESAPTLPFFSSFLLNLVNHENLVN
jgi:hypothetical protein